MCRDYTPLLDIFMRPSYKPHYALCPSVCLSTSTGSNSKTKKCRKSEIGIDVPQGTSKWSADYQLKGQRWRSQDVKTNKTSVTFTDGQPIKRRRIRRRVQTKPMPLLGLIYCRCLNMRRSTTGRTAACHVKTLRRHACLLNCSIFRLVQSAIGILMLT